MTWSPTALRRARGPVSPCVRECVSVCGLLLLLLASLTPALSP